MRFLRENRRVSFLLGNVNAWELPYKQKTEENGNELITRYDFGNGLIVTNIAKKHEKFGAYEWVNYFENTSNTPTEIISDLWDCNVALPLEREEERKWLSTFPDVTTCTKIYAPSGSTWGKKEFYCNAEELREGQYVNIVFSGETKTYSASGGRSSETRAPFFNIHKNGAGYVVAVGWTGQWHAEISRTSDTVIIKSKIEDTHFRLLPAEKFRTSSVTIMPYKGDVYAGHNLWRRLLKQEFSPISIDGKDKDAPLCASVWGGMTSESIIKRVRQIHENDIPIEYFWIDAGWYGENTMPTPNEFEGDWAQHTGDWRVSPHCHPNRLKDVSAAVHDAGMKLLLWFEPERAVPSVSLVKEHPEYFLKEIETDKVGWYYLLNLGNKDAWTYCYQTLKKLIEELHIDCYRQDFNFSPLPYWRVNDSEDRQGITEIKHINGLYRLWDELLNEFPDLLIDNCASGGRRIDIETLKRSVPLWRSDMQCPKNYDVESAQTHNQTYNLWMPYSGTGSGGICDEYRIRSAYAAGLSVNSDLFENVTFVKKYIAEYVNVRPYFSEDFYPLTEVSQASDVWCAMQFHRPETGDGIVEIFVRKRAPYETACFQLKGLEESAEYLFTDADGGEFKVSGKDLLSRGLSVTVVEKCKAKIYFYKTNKEIRIG